ncbi:MAG: M15 family metallopeptidase [Armatimonadota bacterium]
MFASSFPPRPPFDPLTTAQKQRLFGPLRTKDDPKRGGFLIVDPAWRRLQTRVVEVPQLRGVSGAPRDRRVRLHERAVEPFLTLWQAWEAAGLLGDVLTWDGGYVPRRVRGARSLSSHAFGIAFDINARWNPLGRAPAPVGTKGSVIRLVRLANQYGFFWGGHFRSRPDGMHFELARVETP